MGMERTALVLLWIALLWAAPTGWALAQQEEEEALKLEQITVTEIMEALPAHAMSIVGPEEVSQPTLGGSVVDALEKQAGIQLQRTSLVNPENNKLRLRGFDETRLRVMVDGVPIQRDGSYGGAGSVHWSTLSTENIERIEIQRGAASAKYGNTLGGVIDIVTKAPSEKPKTTVSSTYGSFNTSDTQLSHAARAGRFHWSLAGSHFETDGYLRNNDQDRNNAALLLGLDLPLGFEVGAGFEYSEMDTGMAVYNRPDSPYYDGGDPDADAGAIGGPGTRMRDGDLTWGDGSYAADENTAFKAYLRKKLDQGSIKVNYRLWNQERTEYYYDAADASKKIYERRTQIEDDNWLLTADAEYALKNHKLECGGEIKQYGWGNQTVPYIDTAYFQPSINYFYYVLEGFEGQLHSKQYAAVYAQDTWRFQPKWVLEAGLRQEWYSSDKIDPEAFGYDWTTEEEELDENHLDPRLALTWRPWEGGSATARFGIAHRYPTSPEHFWWYLNKGSGFFNTTLDAEEAYQYELGITQRLFDTVSLTVRGYYYDIENYIGSTFVAGVGSVVYNIGEVQIKGFETELAVDLPQNFQVWGNFTRQEGQKSDDPWDAANRLANELPDFPDMLLNLGAGYHGDRLRADLSLGYVPEREHFDGSDRVELDAYTLLRFNAACRVWKNSWSKWEVLLAAQNLLDEDYEEEFGYPMPGATVLAGLKATF